MRESSGSLPVGDEAGAPGLRALGLHGVHRGRTEGTLSGLRRGEHGWGGLRSRSLGGAMLLRSQPKGEVRCTRQPYSPITPRGQRVAVWLQASGAAGQSPGSPGREDEVSVGRAGGANRRWALCGGPPPSAGTPSSSRPFARQPQGTSEVAGVSPLAVRESAEGLQSSRTFELQGGTAHHVTNNLRDLRVAEEALGIRVLTPDAFLALLE